MAHNGHSYKRKGTTKGTTKGYEVLQGTSPRRGDLGPVVGRKTADTAETSLKGELHEHIGKDGEEGWI